MSVPKRFSNLFFGKVHTGLLFLFWMPFLVPKLMDSTLNIIKENVVAISIISLIIYTDMVILKNLLFANLTNICFYSITPEAKLAFFKF